MIQKQFTPVFLKIPSQYSWKWTVTVVKHDVKVLDKDLVVHLLDAAMNLLPYGVLCNQ